MKKICFMMLALMMCMVCTLTACSDDDGDKTPVNPISNCSVPSTAEIGTEVLVRGTGFDASTAKLQLRDANGTETAVADPSFTSSGATFTVPMPLKAGDYTLVLYQNGVWELGKINLTPAAMPIIGLSFPTEAYIGKELVLAGNNFDANCKIYVQKEGETTMTEIPVADRSNGLVCTVPATVAEGTYNLVLAQSGAEWVLGEITMETYRRLKSLVVEMDYSAFDMGIQEIPYYLTYNDQEQVEKVCLDEEGTMALYSFAYSNDEISAESEDYYPFTFKVADDLVVKHIDGSREYDWTYNDNKLTEVKRTTGTKPYYSLEWNDNNVVNIDDTMFAYDKEKKVKGIDLAKCIPFLLTQGADLEIFYAELLGLCGTKSTNLPTEITTYIDDENTFTQPLNCEVDEKGYVTKVSMAGNMDYFQFPTTIKLVYE